MSITSNTMVMNQGNRRREPNLLAKSIKWSVSSLLHSGLVRCCVYSISV